MSPALRAALPIVLLAALVAALVLPRAGRQERGAANEIAPPGDVATERDPTRAEQERIERPARRFEPIRWRRSRALGSPSAGRLVRGVRLPSAGRHFFTWDPVLRRSPNRPWRRWGTGRLVRLVLAVAREHRRAHPRSPRLGIGDLSRPRGGDFGPQFGFIGHASHQNGLDVDVYYPRRDRRERAPRRDGRGIDRRLSQALVDRFVAHGAEVVFVGPRTGLVGPAGRVQTLVNHDNHMHVRLPAG